MATTFEHAGFASRVYAASDRNRTIIPDGWSEFDWQEDYRSSGFSAGVYVNDLSGEVVIAYTGTNDYSLDWLNNFFAGSSLFPAPQILNAMLLYDAVKAAFPNAPISFTGHSLGGGLASLMAIFFDKPAVVFAEAPFEASARNFLLLGDLSGLALLAGLSDDAFSSYVASLGGAFAEREGNVTHLYLEGEALHEVWPVSVLPRIAGSEVGIGLGESAADSVERHSMLLHEASIYSYEHDGAFLRAVRDMPNLASLLLDPSLYATEDRRDPTKTDILSMLLRHQFGDLAGLPPDGMFDGFSRDVDRLRQDGLIAIAQGLEDALIKAVLQGYYRQESSRFVADLLTAVAGGFYLEPAGITGSDALISRSEINQALSSCYGGVPVDSYLSATDRWYFQAGGAGLRATADDGHSNLMLGGSQGDALTGASDADVLLGGSGVDMLVGMNGDDTLIGGAGDDQLQGGQGHDTYLYQSGDGTDTITDSDGNGVIEIDGTVLTGGEATTAGGDVFLSSDGRFRFVRIANGGASDLWINNTIRLANFSPGALGIQLNNPDERPPGELARQIDGDLAPIDQDDEIPGVQIGRDELGNVITDRGNAEPDRIDVLYDSAGNDHIRGWGGDDRIDAARGGDDRLEGGAGNDVVNGHSGRDVLIGNAGQDVLRGDGEQDRLFADDEVTLETARTTGETQSGNGQRGDWLDGGVHDDTLVGGSGNDALLGGAGMDTLIAGGGDDHVMGDEAGGSVQPDWEISREAAQSLDGTAGFTQVYRNANVALSVDGDADLIFGGAGADWLYGQAGDDIVHGGDDEDVIFGGEGNDVLQGQGGSDIVNGDGDQQSAGGNDVVSGGEGDDALFGGDGDDYLDGGDGIDSLAGGNGDDLLIGGAGNDGGSTVHYWSAGLIGGRGNDVLYGGEGDDDLHGDSSSLASSEHGNDTLHGEAGSDVLVGGAGDDSLDGGSEADQLYGEAGDDLLVGGDGDDTLDGGSGADVLEGGRGADIVNTDVSDTVRWLSGDGVDTVYGTAGRIELQNLNSDEVGVEQYETADGEQYLGLVFNGEGLWLSGGFLASDRTYEFADGGLDQARLMRRASAVHLHGTEAGDIVYGGDRDDVLLGHSGNAGGADGNDVLHGQDGADTLEGGFGNDRLDGGLGGDELIGGPGDDIYVIGETTDVVIELAAEGNDTVESAIDCRAGDHVENIALLGRGTIDAVGNRLNNRLLGNVAANALEGLEGDDVLLGRAGNDRLNGGTGIDSLYGEDGNDRLDGGTGDDRLYGGAGDDLFIADTGGGTDVILDIQGRNTVQFGQGVDRNALDIAQYQGDDGAHYLRIGYGNAGDAIVVKDGLSGVIADYRFADGSVVAHEELIGVSTVPMFLAGTNRGDVLHGSQAPDTIAAGDGDDALFGAAGNDALNGGNGDDQLDGGAGDDRLNGGSGNDVLAGGTGADRYIVSWNMGSDLISEDGADSSTIELGDGIRLDDLDLWRDADDLIIRLSGDADGLRIENYAAAPQIWNIQTGADTVQSLSDCVSALPPSSSPVAIDAVIRNYQNRVRALFVKTLTGPGGYRADADGVLHRVVSTVDGYGATTTRYRAEFHVQPVVVTGAGYERTHAPYLRTGGLISQSTSFVADVDVSPGASVMASASNAGMGAYHGFESDATGFEVPLGATLVNVYGTSQDQNGGQAIELGTYDDALGQREALGVWIFASGAAVPQVQLHSIDQRVYRYDSTVMLEDIRGNDVDNDIRVQGYASVDAGGGDDTLIAAYPRYLNYDGMRWTGAHWEGHFGPAFWDSEYHYDGPYDARNHGALLYGNSGSDKLFGGEANDVLIGGGDADVLDGGTGEDTYIVRPGDIGFDVIMDAGRSIWIESESGGSRYADWHYQSIGLRDYVQRYFDGEAIPPLPAVQPNDYSGLQPLVDAGVLERDTVEFAQGIALQDLVVSWGTYTPQPDLYGAADYRWLGGDALHTTLDISWQPGEGIRVVIPHSYLPEALPPDDEPLPAFPSWANPLTRTDEYLGQGIERFRFADGTVLSMADMMALAPPAPTFDPHLQPVDLQLRGTSGPDVLAGGDGNDTLDGLQSADRMAGGRGDDSYFVDDLDDVVAENAGEGMDTVHSVIGHVLADNVENLLLMGLDAINGTGNPLNNTLTGNAGANVLHGGAGDDALRGMAGDDHLQGGDGDDLLETGQGLDHAYGGAGNDTVIGGDATPGRWLPEYLYGEDGDDLLLGGGKYAYLYGGAGNDELRGGAGRQELYGEEGDDILIAGGGGVVLDGGAGADRMIGNSQYNIYAVDDPEDVITEAPGAGSDTVQSSIDYTLGDELENLTLTGTAAINGRGNGMNNILDGSVNTAVNVLTGGMGDDIYRVGSGDQVVELGAEGTDTVYAALSYVLGENVENVTLVGGAASHATGNALDNRLIGNASHNILQGLAGDDFLSGWYGNDSLNGGAGADRMWGGVGNDNYFVDDPGDIVAELAGQGSDQINSLVSYALTDNVEHLRLIGVDAIDATGNALSNTVTGNDAANVISGGAGNDTLLGRAGDDRLQGGAGNDRLAGGAGNDRYLFGRGDHADVIDDHDSLDALAAPDSIIDSLHLDADVSHDQLWFIQSGNDLVVRILGTRDELTVDRWYDGPAHRIEKIHSGNGYVLTDERIDQLVQAMAAFAPPLMGELDLPVSYRNELDPVLAASWQAA